jgi:hypothetical protein
MSRALVWTLLAPLLLPACNSTRRAPDEDTGPPTAGFRCVDCLASSDCGDGECIQYALDVACAPSCGAGGACDAGSHCDSFSTVAGEQVMVCVPDVPACGMVIDDAGPPDAGTDLDAATDVDAGAPTTCGGLVAPSVSSCCTCSSGHSCAANGCYGGWWCNTASCRCQAPPTTCGGVDAGPVDAGAPMPDAGPPTGSVAATGGTVSRLFFGVIGDTRPAVPTDGTSGYPTPIITQLYADLESLTPRPQFAITTGDYCFASPTGPGAHLQMGLYLGARDGFSNTVFYAMGNHECTGATRSNCGPSGADGVTNNYRSFLDDMLSTIGQTEPYYAIRIDGAAGDWTSKLIFAAPNAWDSAQAAFLRAQLAIPTTYTFVVYHEPSDTTSGPPGLAPLDTLLASNPVTLRITGHTHTYYHQRGTNEVTIGLGGAPPTGTYDYGYLTVTQLATGDIEVAEYSYMGGGQNAVFRVHPDGSAAP